MIELNIDGVKVMAPEGARLLDAARDAGFRVPSLCHHPAVEPEGACRLCVVELRGAGEEHSRVVPSCLEVARAGMTVATASEDVLSVRRTVLELLLQRSPASPVLRALAAQAGMETAAGPLGDAHGCILCGLCTRVCAAAGFHAISTLGRGAEARVGGPGGQPPQDCVGCAACAHVCPTGHIALEESGSRRGIWGRDFELLPCAECGVPTIPREQAERAASSLGFPSADLARCPACNRKATAVTFGRIVALSSTDAREGVKR
ncbi:MAG: (2Fe-2S)-binding protein [Candidatus Wallbacteria bacterium]|nr:(2Fe-2S)-binding protein [Candidatus Wallbacteria bacterium]